MIRCFCSLYEEDRGWERRIYYRFKYLVYEFNIGYGTCHNFFAKCAVLILVWCNKQTTMGPNAVISFHNDILIAVAGGHKAKSTFL